MIENLIPYVVVSLAMELSMYSKTVTVFWRKRMTLFRKRYTLVTHAVMLQIIRILGSVEK